MAVSIILRVDQDGARPAAEFHLVGQDAIIGRDPVCDLVLDDPSVSGRHGAFRAGPGGYTYTDLASRNGSAIAHVPGGRRPVLAGEVCPIEAGDVILIGAADAPVRVLVEDGVAPYAAVEPSGRTVAASLPLADLLASAPDPLVALAARAMAAGSPDDLALAALEWLGTQVPRASGRAVRVSGAGFTVEAGNDLPDGLGTAAMDRQEVVLFHDASDTLPRTRSIAAEGMRSALVAPLVAHGSWHGLLAAWSSAGVPVARPERMGQVSVGASLVALAAASLAVRREGVEALQAMESEVARLKAARVGGDPGPEPVGTSRAFAEVLDLCRTIAPTDVPVLLVGETGTGKEVLARAIHRWSRRAERPFVAFNCAAVPETLLESELFGHVKGSYTGAGADRAGLFEEANGGTILLDEIGEMPQALQAKLLRVLQDGEVRRVGSNRTARVDVRVLSATNRDLWKQVEKGAFRSDLMYRLNAVTVRIPALRERRDDISVLAYHLLGAVCRKVKKRVAGFTVEAMRALVDHDFPGNVRELENEVVRAVALTPEGLAIERGTLSIPARQTGVDEVAPRGTGRTLHEIVEAAERRAIAAALEEAGGNVSQAARELGVTRSGLYKTMTRLGIATSD